jgi:hypothetical protein
MQAFEAVHSCFPVLVLRLAMPVFCLQRYVITRALSSRLYEDLEVSLLMDPFKPRTVA